ncbi:MAG: GNAT family N-acetyltransferase [Marinilabiliales bacterium]|nr:MAG: GNAT family N-acetyltransferase [Marinilabiliales bacterium]
MRITGEKIVLRSFRKEDLSIIYQWHNSEELRHDLIVHPFPVTINVEDLWLNRVLNDTSNKNIYFAIEEKDNKQIVGYLSLTKINWVNRNCYFGIVIGDKAMQGRGMGKEATKCVLNYTFNNLGLKKILLEVLATNNSAIALYKKLGFEEEGRLKNQFFSKGKYHDIIIMSVFNK